MKRILLFSGFFLAPLLACTGCRGSSDHSCDSLIGAVRHGDFGRVKALAEGAIDINVRDESGRTALHWAAERGSKETVDLLLARRADFNARDDKQQTPLHLAAAGGHEKMVELLLEAGAKADALDSSHSTPLQAALRSIEALRNTVDILRHKLETKPEGEAKPGANAQSNYPAWVLKGSGAFTSDAGRAFYGVGSAPKLIDASMQRDRANNRARRQILQIFNIYIAFMMKDYAIPTTASDMSKDSYEAAVLQVQRTISIGDINAAQIVDTWRNPSDGTIYSLAVLDLAVATELLTDKAELDARLRDYVRANAAKPFDDMEKEEAKRRH